MSSRRSSSKGLSLCQPPIVYTVCNCRLLRKLFFLFSSRPKNNSTTSYSPSSSTTFTTTTATTTTTIDTRDPLSLTTNPLNEGRPYLSTTKTGQTAYSPSSSTTLTTTMAATITTTYHTWDYYGRNNYLNESRPNHTTRERKPRRKKRICNNSSVIRESAPVTLTSTDYYGHNNYLNESRPNHTTKERKSRRKKRICNNGSVIRESPPVTLSSANPIYDFSKLMVEMITMMEIDTWDDLQVMLSQFLKVNSRSNHPYIKSAFIAAIYPLLPPPSP